MNILVMRYEKDGSQSWEVHELHRYDYDWEGFGKLLRAHLNTEGVTKLEIIPEAS
jgi:YD repeat-containing protein